MRTKRLFSLIIFTTIAIFIFAGCEKEQDPKVEITIVDEKNRPIPGAKVELFSRPTNLIREDIKFTDADGKTYHEFVFEGTLDVTAYINKFLNFENLHGTDEVILVRDETYKTTITLVAPIPPEE